MHFILLAYSILALPMRKIDYKAVKSSAKSGAVYGALLGGSVASAAPPYMVAGTSAGIAVGATAGFGVAIAEQLINPPEPDN